MVLFSSKNFNFGCFSTLAKKLAKWVVKTNYPQQFGLTTHLANFKMKLAKWVVKPNHYLTLGFTTHLTNSVGIKVLMKLAKWVVKPKVK